MLGYIVHDLGRTLLAGPYASFERAVEVADRLGPGFILTYGRRQPGSNRFETAEEPRAERSMAKGQR